MAEYEKVRRFAIPVDNEHLLLISTEVDAELNMIYDTLKHMIKTHDRKPSLEDTIDLQS